MQIRRSASLLQTWLQHKPAMQRHLPGKVLQAESGKTLATGIGQLFSYAACDKFNLCDSSVVNGLSKCVGCCHQYVLKLCGSWIWIESRLPAQMNSFSECLMPTDRSDRVAAPNPDEAVSAQ